MNSKPYRLTISTSHSTWMPVSQAAHRHGAVASCRGIRVEQAPPCALRTSVALLAAAGYLTLSAPAGGQAPLPQGTLPVAASNFVASGSATASTSGANLTVNQSTPKAILNWNSFNIGAKSTVQFVQPSAASSVLNRIGSSDPSRIEGALRANGQVYLINQNGIIFGSGAQINVGGLVASTLDISDSLFLTGFYSNAAGVADFVGDPASRASVQVEPKVLIRTSAGGSVVLLAPRVENNGVIEAPDGQVILAAGHKAFLTFNDPEDSSMRSLLVEVKAGSGDLNLSSHVVNNGTVSADRGNVSFAGLLLDQNGRVQVNSAVRLNGSIWLKAREADESLEQPVVVRHGTLHLAPDSVTETPLAGTDTLADSQAYTRPEIRLEGKTIIHEGRITSPGGKVSFNATDAQARADLSELPAGYRNDSRVYIGERAAVDVAGTWADVPMARNVVEVNLRGAALQNAPLQRDGVLDGRKIFVDVRKGTPLTDITSAKGSIQRTVQEKAAPGGDISLLSEGDVVIRDNALLDVSGGGFRYLEGAVDTTKLITNGKIIDISTASPNLVYSAAFEGLTVTNKRWGVSRSFQPVWRSGWEPGYIEGKAAGQITISGRGGVVLGGTLRGNTTRGTLQRQDSSLGGGRLVVGDTTGGISGTDFQLGDVLFRSGPNPLSGTFDPLTTKLADVGRAGKVYVDVSALRRGGFEQVNFAANGRIEIPEDVSVALPAGAQFTASGGVLDVAGDVLIPAGTITLQAVPTFGAASSPHMVIRDSAVLDARGMWVNDSPALVLAPGADPVRPDGGLIRMTSAGALDVRQGALLDVSGGGWVQRNGKLVPGNGGGVSIGAAAAGGLVLEGRLRGYALGAGGELSLSVLRAVIGNDQSADPGAYLVRPSFFQSEGFGSYRVNADRVTVADETRIEPVARNRMLAADYAIQPSGADIRSFSEVTELPVGVRKPVTLTLESTLNDPDAGDLLIGMNALLRVDPKGAITLSSRTGIGVLGTLEAPAGSISLTIARSASLGQTFDNRQSIWLGQHSKLLAAGHSFVLPDSKGLRRGEIAGGGTVSLTARTGYIVAEHGSVIDVSGTRDVVDIVTQSAGRTVLAPVVVASNAGSIRLSTREGMLLDGQMLATAADTAARGRISVSIERGADLSQIDPSFPVGPVAIHVMQSVPAGGFIPAGLTRRAAVPDSVNGSVYLASSQLGDAGFDTASLTSQGSIVFEGVVTLATRRSLTLDAPVLEALGTDTVKIQSSAVSLGNTNFNYQTGNPSAAAGDARLEVKASGVLDLIGAINLRGFKSALLESAGDLRTTGVVVTTGAGASATSDLLGSLTSRGDLTLTAAQVYPTAASKFTFAVRDDTDKPNGEIHITRQGSAGAALSAGGALTFSAARVVHSGVVKAPLGAITLAGAVSVVLSDGSLSSTSADGLQIPFGGTVLQQSWQYQIGNGRSLIVGVPPEKRVVLDSPSVTVARLATIDLTGGGEVLGTEFVPGPDAAQDRLVGSNTFAILPALDLAYAPVDVHMVTSGQVPAGLSVGDVIYLSGGNVPAGYYALLPGQYAQLPGGFVVKPIANTTDALASQNALLPNGGWRVAGYRGIADTPIRDARWSAFEVRAGSAVVNEARYQQSRSSFFADAAARGGRPTPILPADAGELVIRNASSINVEGQIRTGHAPGTRGGRLDLSMDRIAIVKEVGAADSFIQIPAAFIQGFGWESVLVGGSRTSTADGLVVDVGAQEVELRGGAVLSMPELILAARDRVAVLSGASIEASGTLRANAGDLVVSGDGALLRASADGLVNVCRTSNCGADGAPARQAGTLTVEAGAKITASGSLILDATLDTDIDSKASYQAPALSIASSLISLGHLPSGLSGLRLDGDAVARLSPSLQLILRSYSSIDFYGDVALGAIDPSTGVPGILSLALDSQGLRSVQAGAVAIRAGAVIIANSSGDVTTAASGGAGTLSIEALRLPAAFAGFTDRGANLVAVSDPSLISGSGRVMLGAGRNDVSGFDSVAVSAAQELVVTTGTGEFNAGAALTLDAPRISALAGSDYAIRAATGPLASAPAFALEVKDRAAPLELSPSSGVGSRLVLAGETIDMDGRIELPSGSVTLQAAKNLTIEAGASIAVNGREWTIGRERLPSPGGIVVLRSASGGIAVEGASATESAAHIDVSGTQGADAGTVAISSPAGPLMLAGTISGQGGAGARGGRFELDAKALDGSSASLAQLLDVIAQGGFDSRVALRLRQGNVALAQTVKAAAFGLTVDAGSATVSGTIDASGVRGGDVQIAASGDVVLTGTILASATGAGEEGGRVELNTRGGQLDLRGSIQVRRGVFENEVSGPSFVAGGGSTSAPNIYAGSFAAALNGYKAGLTVRLQAPSANTGAAAVSLNGSGAVPLLDAAGAALTAGAIGSGQMIEATFDGSAFRLVRTFPVEDGSVLLRAPRTIAGTDIAIKVGDSFTVLGSGSTIAEAVKVYTTVPGGTTAITSLGTTTTSGRLLLATVNADNRTFMNVSSKPNAGALASRLGAGFALHPGVEVTSSGDLTIAQDWDLLAARYSGEPGTLTLRAAGNLKVDATLSDGFAGIAPESALRATHSWSYRLVGGADLTSADPLATQSLSVLEAASRGSVSVASGKLVRTGTGEIRIAAGLDLTLGDNRSAIYTAGTPILGTQYPEDGGDIELSAGRDLIGRGSGQYINDWLRRTTSAAAFGDKPAGWWPVPRFFRQGVATFGGGDIRLAAGNNLRTFSAMVASSALEAGAGAGATLRVRGGGDLSLSAGNSVIGGDYLVSRGAGEVRAVRDVGQDSTGAQVGLFLIGESDVPELERAAFEVVGGSQVVLQNISTPTAMALSTPTGATTTQNGFQTNFRSAYFSYASDSAVKVTALSGDLLLGTAVAQGSLRTWSNILPPVVDAVALNGSLRRSGALAQVLFPSEQNAVRLVALGDVTDMALSVSDTPPELLPAWNTPRTASGTGAFQFPARQGFSLQPSLQHLVVTAYPEDAYRYVVVAGAGSINDSAFNFPAQARIEAGEDMKNASLGLQNTRPSDLTVVRAGRAVVNETEFDAETGQPKDQGEMQIGGPGRLLVQAGGDVTLGTSPGIIAGGDRFNGSLGSSKSASVTLLVGVKRELAFDAIDHFFAELLEAGQERDEARADRAVAALLPAGSTGPGDLTMYYSTITTDGNSGIDVIVPEGSVNAGLSSPVSRPEGIGLVTKLGGAIRTYLKKDFLVNESRLLTLQGGDLMIYTSAGDIDAGRGAQDSLTTSAARRRVDPATGAISFIVPAEAQGSGIRTLTSDPDGPGPLPAPSPGNVYLFAPKGTVNAGDAGIVSAGNIVIAAVQVLNASNISAGGTVSGVPVAPVSPAAGLAAAAGATAGATSSVQDSTRDMAAKQSLENAGSFLPSFITVEVIGLGEETAAQPGSRTQP